tara:strand:- start:303 stop:881 length:579 start_codon:yes stop_codon:yes gene_type:complete
MIILKKFFILIALLFLIISCQSSKTIEEVIFDNNKMAKVSFRAENLKINNTYEMILEDPYIDYAIEKPPLFYLNEWIKNNITNFGSENFVEIDIIQASLSKIERKIENKKKYVNQNEFYYELNYKIELKILNDNSQTLSKVKSEVKLSTTSGNFISLNEEELIINNLILNSLTDLSFRTEELVKKHMDQHIF